MPTKTVSTKLRAAEVERLQAIAKARDMTVASLVQQILRDFLQDADKTDRSNEPLVIDLKKDLPAEMSDLYPDLIKYTYVQRKMDKIRAK